MGGVLKFGRAVLVLGRVSNLPTVWTNCLAGWVLAGRFSATSMLGQDAQDFVRLLVGVSLLYVGGMALNDACDAKWDRKHAKGRPIPSGALSVGDVWVIGGIWLGAGTAILVATKPAAWPVVVGLLAAIVLYDVVHKRWAGAVLLMGGCRFLVYVTAGVVAFPSLFTFRLPERLGIAAAGLFLYIVGVTAAARGESTGGKVPLWAWALLLAPVIAWSFAGPTWMGAVFAALFLGWLGFGARMLRGDDPARVGRFVGALLAGIALLDAMMASVADVKAAWICVAFLPLTLLLQRFVPPT